MVKNLAYYPSQCAKNAPPVLSAMLSSARRAGIQTTENSLDCDAALIWSVLWQGRMVGNRIVYEHYRALGRPVLVVDIGALQRGRTWKVAVDHVNAMGYYGHDRDLDLDRPKKLGITLRNCHSRSDDILIAAQHSNSLQWHGQTSPEHWVQQQVLSVRKYSDRPIKIRSHPRCPLKNLPNQPGVQIEVPRHRPGTYDDFDISYSCHAVINHNSGPGIQAAISQTAVVVDQSSLAWPVSISMDEIDNPPLRDRDQWLIEMCHTEYTLEELERGLWLERLATRL